MRPSASASPTSSTSSIRSNLPAWPTRRCATPGPPHHLPARRYRPAGTVSGERGALGPGQQEEQVIPIVKEELAVGKRASERRYRIHTYAVETPVEKEVTLHDERVVIERRPVSGDREIGRADIPQGREYEVIERHEEPIVEKRARNVEEVVVRREANERTQTVRDTVRETKVDVENEAGGLAEDRERNLPNRTP